MAQGSPLFPNALNFANFFIVANSRDRRRESTFRPWNTEVFGLPSFMTKCRLPTVCYCQKILTLNWQLDEKCYERMLGTPIIHISECIRCRIIFPLISHIPDQSCCRLIERTKIHCTEFASCRKSITSF